MSRTPATKQHRYSGQINRPQLLERLEAQIYALDLSKKDTAEVILRLRATNTKVLRQIYATDSVGAAQRIVQEVRKRK